MQADANRLGSLVLGGALGHALAQRGEAALERYDLGLRCGGTSLGRLGIFAGCPQALSGGLVKARQTIGLTAGLAQLALEAQLVVAGRGDGGTGDAFGLLDRFAVARGIGECCSGGRAGGLIVAYLLLDAGEIALAGQSAPGSVASTEGNAAISIEAATVGQHTDAALHVEQVLGPVDQQDAIEQTTGDIARGLDARLEWHARALGLSTRQAVETQQRGALERIVGQQVDGVARRTRDGFGGAPRKHGRHGALDTLVWANLVGDERDASITQAYERTIETIATLDRIL